MQKYGDVTKVDVVRGKQATVLNEHFAKTGKSKVSDFTEDEKSELAEDLSLAEDED